MCLTPIEPSVEPSVALEAKSGEAKWKCFIGGRNIHPGHRLIGRAVLQGGEEVGSSSSSGSGSDSSKEVE